MRGALGTRAVATAATTGGLLLSGVLVAPPALADATVSTWAELSSAFGDGGTVTLAADITADLGQSLAVTPGRPVTLDLHGHRLTIGNPAARPAIGVPAGASFAVEDTAGAGVLTVHGGSGSAGIGGKSDSGVGSVSVASGRVDATGGPFGAGIGGGGGTLAGDGGAVTVSGGAVFASGDDGAGIGGGGSVYNPSTNAFSEGGDGGSLTITGGLVKASGGDDSAGVGGGYGFGLEGGGDGGDVVVSGGELIAQGAWGAGIGGGVGKNRPNLPATRGGDGGSVVVSGGTVTAEGLLYGAAIGGGTSLGSGAVGGDGGSLSVSGGAVVATGYTNAVGIGGGGAYSGPVGGQGAAVTIGANGSVTASAASGDSAIGGGKALFGSGGSFGSLSNAGSLTIPEGSSLIVPSAVTGNTATNSGVVKLAGALTGAGVVYNPGTILPTGSGSVAGNGRGPAGTALLVDVDNFALAFDTNGGGGVTPSELQVYAATVAASQQSLPPGPTPPSGQGGFTGWYTAPTGGLKVSDSTNLPNLFGPGPTTPPTRTLYAHYQQPQQVQITSTPPADPTAGGTYVATATGGGSGTPVTISIDPSSGAGVCSAGPTTSPSGGNYQATVNFTGATGQCVIDAGRPGDADYLPAQAQQTLTVGPGAASTVTPTAGNNQSAAPRQNFPTPLAATVSDSFGNPVAAGTQVTFRVTSGSAGFAGQPTTTATTNAQGVATATTLLSAGSTPGPVTVTATTVNGASGAFTETVTDTGPARADLAVGLSANPPTAPRGGTVKVTATVTNKGPSAAANTLTGLSIPNGYNVTSTGGGVRYGNTVVWADRTALAKNGTRSYTVTLTATRRGTSTFRAGTLSTTLDPGYGNNSATLSARTS